MAENFIRSKVSRPDMLVPVPLYRRRLRQQGFIQSLELARHLGRLLLVPVAVDVC